MEKQGTFIDHVLDVTMQCQYHTLTLYTQPTLSLSMLLLATTAVCSLYLPVSCAYIAQNFNFFRYNLCVVTVPSVSTGHHVRLGD